MGDLEEERVTIDSHILPKRQEVQVPYWASQPWEGAYQRDVGNQDFAPKRAHTHLLLPVLEQSKQAENCLTVLVVLPEAPSTPCSVHQAQSCFSPSCSGTAPDQGRGCHHRR